jgi:predicted RNase H-like HicB family nuclease
MTFSIDARFYSKKAYYSNMSFLNTPHTGSVRNIIFREGNEWFGVALEFNIVETGDSPQEVMVLLDSAIKGYVEAADRANLSIGVLNQAVDPEYEALWNQNTNIPHQKTDKEIYSTTVNRLSALAA